MKNQTSKVKSVTDLPKKKQLGFMSCIVVVIGACIGAGIFFKNGLILTNTGGSFILAIVCWLIGAVGVMAMALSLTEIVSGVKGQSNLGIAAWVKTFNSKFLYQACKNFIAYIYTPLILVSLSYYFVQALFNGIGWFPPWWGTSLIALGVLTWFFFASGLSVKMFNIQNWIIMSLKFFPLIFAIVIGYVFIGVEGHATIIPTPEKNPTALLDNLSPICGIMASIPAIFFAFNGFYYPANLTSSMKEPRKLPVTMIVGLIIVTVIYVGISVSIMLCTKNGQISGLSDWLNDHNVGWIYTVVNILIGVGILSVINGTVATGVNIYHDLLKDKELLFSSTMDRFNKKNGDSKLGAVVYGYIVFIIFFIICTVIGCFFDDTSNILSGTPKWGKENAGIFSFADIVTNWVVLFIFVFIGIAIIGCLRNRKTHKVVVARSKIFMPMAIISVILLAISTLYLVSSVFVNIGLVISYIVQNKYSDPEVQTTALITVILSAVMLFVYLGVTFIPSLVSRQRLKHQHEAH